MINNHYYTTDDIKNIFGVGYHTVMRWRKSGFLPFTKINNRKYIYLKSDVDNLLNNKNNSNINDKLNIIYCRVSTQKQKNDLSKQKQILTDYCNNNGIIPDMIISEIASGMNENRCELNKLVDLVINNKVNNVYITFKDRLTRFGFDYFKNLFNKFNTNIIILNNSINQNNSEQELIDDLISIIHHFSIKVYSDRRKQLKKIQQDLK